MWFVICLICLLIFCEDKTPPLRRAWVVHYHRIVTVAFLDGSKPPRLMLRGKPGISLGIRLINRSGIQSTKRYTKARQSVLPVRL
jgi:hypothetical protein